MATVSPFITAEGGGEGGWDFLEFRAIFCMESALEEVKNKKELPAGCSLRTCVPTIQLVRRVSGRPSSCQFWNLYKRTQTACTGRLEGNVRIAGDGRIV